MEPSPYGSPYPNEQTGWQPPAPPAPQRTGTRIGLVVLTAVVLELLIIGLADNQWVFKQLLKIDDPEGRAYAGSWLTYTWRFSPLGATQPWVAQLMLVATTVVVSALLIWVLLSGAVSWVRAFFGAWLAVLFATVIGAVVRGVIDPYARSQSPGVSRFTAGLLGFEGPNTGVVFAGLLLGFVVAVVTSLLAVAWRPSKPAAAPSGPPAFADYAAPPPQAPGSPPPWQQEYAGQRSAAPFENQVTSFEKQFDKRPPPAGSPAPAEDAGSAPTTALPRHGDAPMRDEPTTRLPPPGESAPPPAAPPAPPSSAPSSAPTEPPPSSSPPPAPAGDQATTRFPRPPDDEELGHIDH